MKLESDFVIFSDFPSIKDFEQMRAGTTHVFVFRI